MTQDTADIKLVKEVIQVIQKARKNLRLYPSNNPIYMKIIEEAYKKVESCLEQHETLALRISRNEIFFGEEIIYQGTGKDDNLALIFFRDGLRELSLKRGLEQEELQGFLEIIATDTESEEVEDDIVTLMWGRDFQNIKYTVEEAVLSEDDEKYEEEATRQAKENAPEEDELEKVYADALKEEAEAEHMKIMPLTDEELKGLVEIIEKDSEDKKKTLVNILFEMLHQSDDVEEFKEIAHILDDLIEYCVLHGDLESAVEVLRRSKGLAVGFPSDDIRRKQLHVIFLYAGAPEIIKVIGELLDAGIIEETSFREYIAFLEKNSIPPLINSLGSLKAIHARKLLIEALVLLGKKDLTALTRGLSDDRWYVVRNIIYVLRKIGDKQAVEYLMKTAYHNDVRVRKEVLTALGELGGQGALHILKEYLDDPEPTVRTSSARALGKIGTDFARNAVIEKISGNNFLNLDFNEKKEYFEVLTRWKDILVVDYLLKTLKKSSLFKRAKYNEMKACAAYSLGIMGEKTALPALEKMRRSKNKLLSDYAYTAMKRIEYGK